MLERMNFPPQFIHLIKMCITTPTFSMLVNGEPQGYFSSNRGIRQGDPLSPYLFCFAMEYISLKVEAAVRNKDITPISNT